MARFLQRYLTLCCSNALDEADLKKARALLRKPCNTGGWNHDAAGTINLYTARLIGRNRPMRILR
jgi:hypothetical protein